MSARNTLPSSQLSSPAFVTMPTYSSLSVWALYKPFTSLQLKAHRSSKLLLDHVTRALVNNMTTHVLHRYIDWLIDWLAGRCVGRCVKVSSRLVDLITGLLDLPSVYLSVCLSVCLSVSLFFCLCVRDVFISAVHVCRVSQQCRQLDKPLHFFYSTALR